MAFSSNASSSNCWVSDTGATDHFTPNLANLQQARDYNGNDAVTVGNGQQLPITHIVILNLELLNISYILDKLLGFQT
jgi:hypothetical protein